jgi:cell pole-organizing protein PopZ
MNSITSTQARISEATAAEQRAHEPSMEEILASIRRIIADDQMLPITRPTAREPEPETAAAPAPVAPRVEAPIARQVFVAAPVVPPVPEARIEEPHVVASAPAPAEALVPEPVEPPAPFVERRPEAVARPIRIETPPRPQPPAQPARAPVREAPRQESPALLSPEMGASVSSAFNALATTMVLQNQGMIEEATRELLRPMLKQWLDDNLPIMVERLVRIEIERVARGGR